MIYTWSFTHGDVYPILSQGLLACFEFLVYGA